MADFTPSSFHRLARTLDLAHPEAFRDKYHPTLAELNDLYDPDDNPNGKIFRIICGFMDDFSFSADPQTDNALMACQQAAAEQITGWDYGFTGTVRADRDFDRFSSNNFLRELTWGVDREYILVDRVKYKGDQFSPAEATDWVRLGEYSTDVPNWTVQNADFVAIAFSPLPSGSIWNTDLVL